MHRVWSRYGRATAMNDQMIPTPEEFIEAFAVAWLRVGYEALELLAYTVKQNDEPNVNDDKEVTDED